jgi:2,4-dienoyl-CoA reductase-like NADH-dependent reductase (Old Yellow Enzyme family)
MSTRVSKYPVEASIAFSYRLKGVPAFVAGALAPLAPLVKPLPKPLENYNVDASRAIKRNVSIPVIVVGGIRRFEDIRRILSEDDADYVAMSRPFITEPNIVDRFRRGEQGSSKCISCGYCLVSLEERAVQCYHGKI